MKLLALDFGEKRVGIAVSDESGIIATPLKYLEVRNDLIHRLGEVIESEKPEKLIFGLPRHQSGDVAVFAKQIKEFAKASEHEYNIEVDFEDESATTVEAERRLKEQGTDPGKWKDLVDSEAAAVILESYIQRIKN